MNPELNPAQKKAVEAPMRPLLIVAGAGTGKTRTLTSRLIHLINSGVEPDKILALTFTNKAAREMMDRLEGELRGLKSHPLIGTFHSLGARILRAEAESAGRTKDFVIFDDHDSFDLIKKLIKEMGFSLKEQKPSEFYRYISAIKNGISTIGETEAPAGVGRATAEEFYKRYEAGLLRHNAFDFDDLLQKLVLVLKNNPEILKKYQRLYQYVLVDEYQDLNNVQYEFLKLLSRDGGNLSVVGDAAQTIYTWRGSNINIFLNFERDWPEAQITLLEENYRSTSNIIDAASGVLLGERTLSPNLKYKLWTKNGEGKAVTLLESGNEEEEAEWIVDKITEIRNKESRIENEKKQIHNSQFPIPSSVAVLYRTNAQSRALEQALLRRGVPYRVFGGMRFYERREIKDVLAGLRYALNRADEISKERLEKSVLKTRFRRFEAELNLAKGQDPLELIRLFLNSTDYLQYIERSMTDPDERKENIAELIHFASEFKELPPFLEQISLLQSADNLSKRNNSDGLILSTVHLAKGLEFDTVFISGVKEGLIPHARSFYDPDAMEEERRLLYVAMTRARKELYLCFYEIPSRFLSAIPEANMIYENIGRRNFVDLDSEERYITYD